MEIIGGVICLKHLNMISLHLPEQKVSSSLFRGKSRKVKTKPPQKNVFSEYIKADSGLKKGLFVILGGH